MDYRNRFRIAVVSMPVLVLTTAIATYAVVYPTADDVAPYEWPPVPRLKPVRKSAPSILLCPSNFPACQDRLIPLSTMTFGGSR